MFSRLVHSVNILLVRPLDLLPLELEGGGDEAGVGQPGRGLQTHAGRHLELLQPVLPPVRGQRLGHRLEYILARCVNESSRNFAIFRDGRLNKARSPENGTLVYKINFGQAPLRLQGSLLPARMSGGLTVTV